MSRIAVHADWFGLGGPTPWGWLHADRTRSREIFQFEFHRSSLERPEFVTPGLDPAIGPFEGRQFPLKGRSTFGVFEDASPDRWGRLLMRRRLEREKRRGTLPADTVLLESDYLLGAHDAFRVGGLRFRLEDDGDFLDNQDDLAAPPFVRLRELEAASLALEQDEEGTARDADEWLDLLLAPGGSLGGARPKASVVDPLQALWIAKFPSARDETDVGGWEIVVHTLAQACDIRVPEAMARKFNSPRHTFLVKRFDRLSDGSRLHFASAMTLTGHSDGDDASSGVSYLELAEILISAGVSPNKDLRELWKRILFNVLVSNCDDHLRNHGFTLVPGKGWELSMAYDMNAVPRSPGLRLNISESDNARDIDLVRSVAPYFRVSDSSAKRDIARLRQVVREWRSVAGDLHLTSSEQDYMADAFALAG